MDLDYFLSLALVAGTLAVLLAYTFKLVRREALVHGAKRQNHGTRGVMDDMASSESATIKR